MLKIYVYLLIELCDLFQMDMPDFPMGIGMIEDSSDSFHKGKKNYSLTL